MAEEKSTKTGETYQQCVDRVKREYPVPPGNINTRNQMIQQECGSLPHVEGEESEGGTDQ